MNLEITTKPLKQSLESNIKLSPNVFFHSEYGNTDK